MRNFGFWEIALIALLAMILFGGFRKFPEAMKNLAGGIKVFKKEMKDDDKPAPKKSEPRVAAKKVAKKPAAKPVKKVVKKPSRKK